MSWEAEVEKLLSITEGEVFEKATLKALWKLMNSGVIERFEFPISTGKEGNVFRARGNHGMVAVKIYRINTATFRSISKYLMYEPPQKVKRDRRSIIFAWALKEFNNLRKLDRAGVRVPKPIAREGNIIVMEYIGTEEQPAPLLKDAAIENYEEVFSRLREYMRIMYQEAGLVHADFSEYNVLVNGDDVVIIDVGQTVSRDNPVAMEFLMRDVRNIANFFRKVVNVDEEELLKYVVGDSE
ncbi:MAG: serine protein kinase RIO [Thermoplasmata archaeon]|jgi:RIO kinase 1|nr:serine protein kinase RIO [Thermoplasmata archaeon]